MADRVSRLLDCRNSDSKTSQTFVRAIRAPLRPLTIWSQPDAYAAPSQRLGRIPRVPSGGSSRSEGGQMFLLESREGGYNALSRPAATVALDAHHP